jgi:hypothetical protein
MSVSMLHSYTYLIQWPLLSESTIKINELKQLMAQNKQLCQSMHNCAVDLAKILKVLKVQRKLE